FVSLTGKLGSEFEAATRRFVTVGDGTTTSLRAHLRGRIPDEPRVSVPVEGTFHEAFASGRWVISHADGRAIDVVRVDPSTTSLDLPAGSLRAELVDAPWDVAIAFDFTVPSEA